MPNSRAIKVAAVSMLLMARLTLSAVSGGGISAIGISQNGRYFIDSDGKPFFWQGDTEWELFHVFSIDDAKALLRDRHNQGFNIVQVMVAGGNPEWAAAKGVRFNAEQAWLNNNPLTPNEIYFKRADAIVAAAEELGIVLVLGVYHSKDCDFGRINFSNARPWAKWLAQRYKNSRNVVWSMYPHAEPASEPIVRAVVRGLKEGDGGAHLITMHPDPSPTSSSFMHTEFWLSFNTLQSWSTDLMNYDMVRSDYARIPAKPVVNGEARYEEEDGTTPLEVRRAGYWAYLAGGFYSYGHRDNWMSPQTWRSWYDKPGAKQMKIMGELFRAIDWWRMIPDQSVFVDSIDGDVAAHSSGGDWIMAYLTSNNPVNIQLSSITASNYASAWWIDPRNGAKTAIGVFPTSRAKEFTPPASCQDAVLLIEKKLN